MKNTLELLRLTTKIMESWKAGEISEIEKDTVLGNLRKIYAEIKFRQDTECRVYEEVPVEPTPEPIAVPAPVPTPEVTPVSIADADADAACEPGEQVTVTITETPTANDTGAVGGETPVIVNSEDETEEFKENILFEEGDIPVKPKLDKKVILSLYGDEPAPVKAREQQPAAPVAEETPKEKVVYQSPVPTGANDVAEPVQVLGDVLNNGNQTVGDVYSEQGVKPDVASVLGAGKVDSLKKAIGINDKFLIIRNLFEGNADAYDSVISKLDSFGDLDDALIHIHENYSWNPDNEAVKLVIDLLSRKFS